MKTSRYDRLARDFEAKVQQIGTPVIHRQAIKSKNCHCVGRTTRAADPDCVFCMGSGHPFSERIVPVIAARSSHTQATSTLAETGPVGPEFAPFEKFLIPGHVVPKIEDTFVEIDYTDGDMYHRVINEFQVHGRSRTLEGVFADTDGARAALVYGPVWDVNYVTPIAFDGRTVYWEVFTKQLRRS